jgi:CBS-domain-containing membrane protein
MKTRIIHTFYLAPAILLLLMWIAAAPSLVAQRSPWEVLGAATVTALVATWCVTLFVHALRRDKP